jgi:uncharacterized damage-inducible protein DinB
MFRKVDDFLKSYEHESATTLKAFRVLTDKCFKQPIAEGHRTLGQIAWHISMSIQEMMSRTGLELGGEGHQPPPSKAADIASAYEAESAKLLAAIRENWDDATLEVVDDMYGEQWARGQTLAILIEHEVHHRGQLSVLMRQAGLTVPGICGPAKEEWAKYGMAEPPY